MKFTTQTQNRHFARNGILSSVAVSREMQPFFKWNRFTTLSTFLVIHYILILQDDNVFLCDVFGINTSEIDSTCGITVVHW